MIQQASGSRHQDVDRLAQRGGLGIDIDTTKNHHRGNFGMDTVGFDGLFDLGGQFAGRSENQHTWAARLAQLKGLGKQHVQNGQGETSGFTRAGLCGSQ